MSTNLNQTEQRLPDLEGFDSWDSHRILATLLAGQRRALDAVERALPVIAQAADAIAQRLSKGGRLLYAGAGTSIRIAVQDGSELPGTYGMPESQLGYLIAGGRDAMFDTLADAEDDAQQGMHDATACAATDSLIAIAASGRTPYTVAAAETARRNRSLVVAVVNNANSPLAAVANFEILIDTGPEVISGSTRMAAGTAQKATLNMLSTLVHTRLGAVHDGLMVNVQANNSKLLERAVGIVSQITGASREQAARALQTSNGEIKLAVVLLSGTANLKAAQAILSESGGKLRLALAKLKNAV